MKYKANLFMAWFFIPMTLVMGWVAFVGRMVLELLGINTFEGDIPGRIVGALLLFGAVYLVLHFRGSLPPEGKQGGSGFGFGHRVVLAANLLATLFIIFQLTHPLIENPDMRLVLDRFTYAFGLLATGCWVVGFSFLYQSSLPPKQ
ncbi:MAG: hypothetical protein IPM27_03560 [Nitrosomonadales bacterium]|nr:hypothetical protein [Nitrosomonadales bacterium]